MSTDTPGNGGDSRRTAGRPPSGLPDRVADDVLASERRRTILDRLATEAGPVPVATLAETVVAAETGTPTADVSTDRREAVKEELYEHDVPTLTALRVAAFDSRVACLTLAEAADDVLDRWAERAADGDLPPAP